MAKLKKLKLKLKVTNKNIRLRFLKEKEIQESKGESFTYSDMALKFGLLNVSGKPDRPLAYKWCTKIETAQRMPNKSRFCPHCKFSVYQLVEQWVNDGRLLS